MTNLPLRLDGLRWIPAEPRNNAEPFHTPKKPGLIRFPHMGFEILATDAAEHGWKTLRRDTAKHEQYKHCLELSPLFGILFNQGQALLQVLRTPVLCWRKGQRLP